MGRVHSYTSLEGRQSWEGQPSDLWAGGLTWHCKCRNWGGPGARLKGPALLTICEAKCPPPLNPDFLLQADVQRSALHSGLIGSK